MLLQPLKYLQGAVARKDYVEQLCHVLIKDGVAIAYDGLLSMSTPIDVDLHVKPHARTLMKAVAACDDAKAIDLSMTAGGRLTVKCGKFRAHVDCLPYESDLAQPLPQGVDVQVAATLLDSFKTLAPLMSVDASRPWAQGLRISGNSTYATNNIILAEYWHGSNFPYNIILPADAIRELIRIGENPVGCKVTETSASFFFSGNRWLRTQLVVGQWPDEQIAALLARGGNLQPIHPELFDSLETLKPFANEAGDVHLFPDRVATSLTDGEGAQVELDYPCGKGSYHLGQLLSLRSIASKIDFSTHPKPCYFQGAKLRGVIIGKEF